MSADLKILEKIKKCLRLAESGNPNEAAVAMLRAQEMMAKYGVEIAQLEDKETGPTRLNIERGSVRSVATATRTKDWEVYLLRKIADAFGCELLFQRGKSKREIKYKGLRSEDQFAVYIFIGVGMDTEVARYTAEVLLRQLKKGKSRFSRETTSKSRGDKTKKVDSYCWGWVRGAVSNIDSMASARKKEAGGQGSSTALKVMNFEERRLAAIKNYIHTNVGGTAPKTNRSRGYDHESRQRGYREGKQSTVRKGISK